MVVTWSADDSSSGLAGCLLEVREGDGPWQQLSTTCTSSLTHPITSDYRYTFRLTASDNVGNEARTETQAAISRVTKYYYHGGQRVAMRAASVVYYVHADHLGSTSLTTDEDGDVVARQLYHPYGTVRYSEGTLPTDFGFTGQREHPGLGLIFMHARYYHAYLNRFISADSIVPNPGNPQSLNRYSYVLGNPLKYRDPSGHVACVDEECNWVENPVTGKIVPGSASDPLKVWRTEVLINLMNAGPHSQHTAQYIMKNDVSIEFESPLIDTYGARWIRKGSTMKILLNTETYPSQISSDDAGLLGVIVHEVEHLKQGRALALSVEGEYKAWQIEAEARIELSQIGIGQPLGGFREEIRKLPSRPTDQDLRTFRSMVWDRYNFSYLLYLLPPRPFDPTDFLVSGFQVTGQKNFLPPH